MNIRLAALIIPFCLMLLSCDSGLGQSDMKGVFSTEHGECVKEGDVGLTIYKDDVHIDFYCFLDKCNDMEGPIEKGGHFYISDSKGHYIQGQLMSEKAKGSWYATINQNKCSGTWFALRKTQ
jgi:hypothetical protein